MFRKVLVANRGEIACRIIRTCERLGIETVAVFSEADRDALHTRQAGMACLLGSADVQQSYLNMERILEVARSSGAEAIHPGYGFLSENPAFARRCEDAGIHFIGPTPAVMKKMGDKVLARGLARTAGLPLLPASEEVMGEEQATQAAWAIGFPLMVKSAEGGGGIGMQVVDSMENLMSLVERTRSVAASAFGSPRLYFERYLKGASHIEVQLIGDHHGNLIHLFERDCSLQRRNQKLVEETPAVKLTPELRREVCRLAMKLGRHIGYTNAGTVEFLVSAQGDIYFLEMNTRLQVEHGITELVCGVDLVELQIRVAAGEPLPPWLDDFRTNGHAVEARVYPEDPDTFLPNIGTITALNLPSGEGIRVDSALENGYEVGLHYEPLLAKVMAWGETRAEAVGRLRQALHDLRLEGIRHNAELLYNVLDTEEFCTATHHTGSLLEFAARRNAQEKNIQGERIHSPNGHEQYCGKKPIPKNNNVESPWRWFGREQQMRPLEPRARR